MSVVQPIASHYSFNLLIQHTGSSPCGYTNMPTCEMSNGMLCTSTWRIIERLSRLLSLGGLPGLYFRLSITVFLIGFFACLYVTVHGKTYVNDLSLKRKNQRTTNEQRTNVPNVSTNYPNVSSIWSEKYERIKAKIHTIF